jgi:oligopeptidase B
MTKKMHVKNSIPPVAPEKPHLLTKHNDQREDLFFWMNQREDPEVISYLKAENTYCNEMLAPTEKLQEKLFAEITGRIPQDDDSVPYLKNGYYYYHRFEKGKEYPIYARKKDTTEAPEEILLDANIMAEGKAYYQLGALSVSPDNRLLAFSEDTLGRRIYTLRFRDLETGNFLEDAVAGISGQVAWANDNQTVLYALLEKNTLRPHKVYRYEIGQTGSQGELVYHEEDNTFRVGVSRTRSGKYLMIGSYAKLTNEYLLLSADDPKEKWRLFESRNRAEKLEYFPEHLDDRWYIRTNWKAENYRLMVCPENSTPRENWKEVVPHRKEVLLEDLDLFRFGLVLSERKAGITRLMVHPFEGDAYEVSFEEEARLVYTMSNWELDNPELRFTYESMTTPPSVYDFNLETRERKLRKQEEVVGEFLPADYQSERLMVVVRDGVKVPVSIVWRKDKRKSDGNPLLLYGYGSYGISLDPYFSIARLSLLDRGFMFAIAHIRGGEEMGRQWYEEGKLLKKKNTFFDFIDVGEFLVKEQYAQKESLFAMGGSAGGLLMGAVINMRPELWKGVIAAVPFVDVLTTMLDDTIPLTTAEYDEWGNPNDAAYYEYIKSYSPYDNLKAANYPNLLVTTGLHDSQVQYWEPAKWVAKMRKLKTGENLLLLHTNMDTGHSGSPGRFERYKETAMDYAFLLYLMGIKQ